MPKSDTSSDLDELLNTPTSELLSRPWNRQTIYQEGNLWSMVNLPLKDILMDLLGLKRSCSMEALKERLSTTSLEEALRGLAGDLKEDSGLVVKVKAKGRKLYVGKGLLPGGEVKFRLAGDRSIKFDYSLNREWKKAAGTPLRFKGGAHVRFDQIIGAEQNTLALTLDNAFSNQVQGQPDYLHFSVLGSEGDHSGDLRLAFLEGGEVKRVEFVFSEHAKHWSQKVYIGANSEDVLSIRREVDTFHAINRNVRWFEELRHLDILSRGAKPKHFDGEPIEIDLRSSQSSNRFLASLKWPR